MRWFDFLDTDIFLVYFYVDNGIWILMNNEVKFYVQIWKILNVTLKLRQN